MVNSLLGSVGEPVGPLRTHRASASRCRQSLSQDAGPESAPVRPHHPRRLHLVVVGLQQGDKHIACVGDIFDDRNTMNGTRGSTTRDHTVCDHASILNLRRALGLDGFLDQRQPDNELAPLPTPSLRPMTLPLWNSTNLRTRCSPIPCHR